MRARQRHLNPKAAGAYTALDSRFEFSVATGTAISSWVSRTGANDASQATGANQPKYTTNAINGQPAILFDGAGDHMTIATSITSNALSMISVAHKTAAGGTGQTYSRITGIWNTADSATTIADYGNTNGWIVAYYDRLAGKFYTLRNSIPIADFTRGYVPVVVSSVLDGSNVTFTNQGVVATGTTSATALNSNEIRFGASPYTGAGQDSSLNGYIAYLVYFMSVLSDSLRRRLERGAGYSFKIACS